jgi:hypothetical protein
MRRRLEEIEEAIAGTPVGAEPELSRPAGSPRLIDLDPERGLSTRQARLARLVRSALGDRGLIRGEPVDEVCARLGARQVPSANSSLLTEAARWLRSWTETPLFRELRDAARGRSNVDRDIRWLLPFPLSAGDSTIVGGRCDLIYRDRKGRWRPLLVSIGPEDQTAEELRSVLAATGIARIGYDRLGPTWRVRPGAGGVLEAEVQLEVSAAVIDAAVRKWLGSMAPASLSLLAGHY